MKTLSCFITMSLLAAVCVAQENPLSKSQKGFYSTISNNVVAAAEKMPEASYAFKPTPEVRTFGQFVGHIADAQYMFCSAAAGEKSPATESFEKSKTSKADLVQAVKAAVAYCDKVYDGMTDAHATEMVKAIGREMPKLAVLSINTVMSLPRIPPTRDVSRAACSVVALNDTF